MSHPFTSSSFSMKGLIIGTVLSAAVGLLAPFGLVFQYFRMGFNPSSQGAVFFFVVIVLINVAVSLIGRRFALPRADLILIYCMLLMAVTVPTWGLMFFLIGTMVYPYYYATPENRFAELFHDLIPTWTAPQDMKAIEYYYEGLPQGATITWQPWLVPLANWFALIMALGFLLICMSSILHRQWSVHERLTYPMLQVPQAVIEEKEGHPAAWRRSSGANSCGSALPSPSSTSALPGSIIFIQPFRTPLSSGTIFSGSAIQCGSSSPGSAFSTSPALRSPSASGSSTCSAKQKRACSASSGYPAPRS